MDEPFFQDEFDYRLKARENFDEINKHCAKLLLIVDSGGKSRESIPKTRHFIESVHEYEAIPIIARRLGRVVLKHEESLSDLIVPLERMIEKYPEDGEIPNLQACAELDERRIAMLSKKWIGSVSYEMYLQGKRRENELNNSKRNNIFRLLVFLTAANLCVLIALFVVKNYNYELSLACVCIFLLEACVMFATSQKKSWNLVLIGVKYFAYVVINVLCAANLLVGILTTTTTTTTTVVVNQTGLQYYYYPFALAQLFCLLLVFSMTMDVREANRILKTKYLL